MSGLFITGTDTGVGKTAVAAAIVSGLRARGIDAVPMKPVQTGCARGVAPDLQFCLSACDLKPSAAEQRRMCRYRFTPACSPHLAATLARKPISLARIRKAFDALSREHDLVIAEGAGGVLVPIGQATTMLDLMKALRLPVLLVARPGLGTINHTLLSLRELKRAGLRVLGVVIVKSAPGRTGRIETDNARAIARFGRIPVLATIPFVRGGSARAFAKAVGPSLRRVFRVLS